MNIIIFIIIALIISWCIIPTHTTLWKRSAFTLLRLANSLFIYQAISIHSRFIKFRLTLDSAHTSFLSYFLNPSLVLISGCQYFSIYVDFLNRLHRLLILTIRVYYTISPGSFRLWGLFPFLYDISSRDYVFLRVYYILDNLIVMIQCYFTLLRKVLNLIIILKLDRHLLLRTYFLLIISTSMVNLGVCKIMSIIMIENIWEFNWLI